jgi:Family of unknown function (DUF5989)
MATLRELLRFLLVRRKVWLWPVFLALLVIGGLVVFTQGSAIAPFIYTIF